MGGAGALAWSFTIPHMLTQQKIQGILPCFPNQVIVGRDPHSLGHSGRTCRKQLVSVVLVYDTDHARGELLITVQITQCGNVCFYLLGRIQDRAVLRNAYVLIVDDQSDILIAQNLKITFEARGEYDRWEEVLKTSNKLVLNEFIPFIIEKLKTKIKKLTEEVETIDI